MSRKSGPCGHDPPSADTQSRDRRRLLHAPSVSRTRLACGRHEGVRGKPRKDPRTSARITTRTGWSLSSCPTSAPDRHSLAPRRSFSFDSSAFVTLMARGALLRTVTAALRKPEISLLRSPKNRVAGFSVDRPRAAFENDLPGVARSSKIDGQAVGLREQALALVGHGREGRSGVSEHRIRADVRGHIRERDLPVSLPREPNQSVTSARQTSMPPYRHFPEES